MTLFSRKTLLWFGGFIAVLAATYGLVAWRYWSNPPRPSRNFAAELNAPLLKIPANRRAWPIYREAAMELAAGAPNAWSQATDFREVLRNDELVAHLRARTASLQKFRAAAKLPSLGYLLSDAHSQADKLLFARHSDESQRALIQAEPAERPSANPVLIGTMFAPEGIPELPIALQADAFLAAADGDSERIADDLTALMSLAEQLQEIPTARRQLDAWHCFAKALFAWGLLMQRSPDAFTTANLQQLEEAATKFSGGTIRVHWDVNRMEFDDVVQRVFSDDAAGNGVFHESDPLAFMPYNPRSLAIRAPVAAYVHLSRKATIAEFDQLSQSVEPQLNRPLWEADFTEYRSARSRLNNSLRRSFLSMWTPHYDAWHRRVEQLTQQRDVILAVSAALRFRLDNRRWPATLDALVPGYLAAVPRDRLSGGSITYLLEHDRPRFISVGFDNKYDGGRAADVTLTSPEAIYIAHDDHEIEPWHWNVAPYWSKPPDGDVILWPVAAENHGSPEN